jgi:hypothetical protein
MLAVIIVAFVIMMGGAAANSDTAEPPGGVAYQQVSELGADAHSSDRLPAWRTGN